MDGSILQQGSFISQGGAPVTLNLVSGVDWVNVFNYTQAGIDVFPVGIRFFLLVFDFIGNVGWPRMMEWYGIDLMIHLHYV
jgi:hypothetical protein